MRVGSLSVVSALVAIVALGATAHVAEGGAAAVRSPDTVPPPVFERLGSLEGLLAFGVRADGRAAVIARPSTRDGRTIVRIVDLDSETDVREMELNGIVRALIFGVDGRQLFGILYRPLKKRTGDSYLIQIDVRSWKMKRGNRLPPTARSIDHWLARDALLIASKDEIRVVFVNGLRSGPLYRVRGRNLAVASVTGDMSSGIRSDGLDT